MPSFPIAVTYADGQTEVLEAGRPAILIAFADTFRKQFPDADGPDMMRELAWLGWKASGVGRSFEEWIETVADLSAQSDEEEAAPEPAQDPSQPATPEQPTEPSPAPETPEPWPEPQAPQEPTEAPQEPRLTLAMHGGG